MPSRPDAAARLGAIYPAVSSHAILGAGGVGGLVAGALARSGHAVTVVIGPGREHPARIRVESEVLGEFEAPVRVAGRLDSPVDVLWVATKAPALEAALGQVDPAAVREAVIPLLNGLDHMAILRSTFGPPRVAAGTIRVEAERLAPGRVRQAGNFIVIELAGPAGLRPVLERVAGEVQAAGMGARVVEHPERALWEKLSFLGPFALASTASGLDLGGVRSDARWRSLALGVMREIRLVAAAEGIELREPEAMLDAAPPGMRSSMQKDAAAGRPLEVEHIAGPILAGGERAGIATPATRELVDIIRAAHPGRVGRA